MLPDVWMDTPDDGESKGVNWYTKILPIDKIMDIAWTVNSNRKPMEKYFEMVANCH